MKVKTIEKKIDQTISKVYFMLLRAARCIKRVPNERVASTHEENILHHF